MLIVFDACYFLKSNKLYSHCSSLAYRTRGGNVLPWGGLCPGGIMSGVDNVRGGLCPGGIMSVHLLAYGRFTA